MGNADILIDVIIPIYNVEAYLPQCLDAFLSQTQKRFHAILVDDGSKDSSGAIAKNYASAHPELFTLVQQENRGLGGARNNGLKHAKAPYVWFFDSDDFCAPRAIEHLCKAIESNPDTDIVFFNPIIFDMAINAYQEWHDAPYIRRIFKDRETISPKDEPRTLELEASVCRCLWRREFLLEAGLSFMEGVCWEDVPPHFLLMHKACSAVFTEAEGCYYYRVNPPKKKQITSGSGKTRLDIGPVLSEVHRIVSDGSWKKREKVFVINFLVKYCMWTLHSTDDEFRRPLVDILHAFFHKFHLPFGIYYFFASKSSMKDRLCFSLFRSPILYRLAYKRSSSGRIKRMFLFVKRLVKGRA